MSSLYEHTEELIELLDAELNAQSQAEHDAASAAIAAQLDLTRDKVDRVAAVLATLEHDAHACSMEAQRLTRRKAELEANALRLKQYTIAAFERARTRRMNGHTHSLGLRYNPPALDVIDEEAVPARFKITETIQRTNVDKRAAKAAIAAGETVPGCRLTQSISLTRA